MPDTLSACQNICQDFGWVAPVTQWLQNVAVIFGVIVALIQLNSWKREARQAKRSAAAEELIVVSMDIKDAMHRVRNPWEVIDKDKVSDPLFPLQMRMDSLFELKDDFRRLRIAQVRVAILIDDSAVEKAVDVLFESRRRVQIAIKLLAGMREDPPRRDDTSLRKLRVRLKRDMVETSAENPLSVDIDTAVATIRSRLAPIARYES